MERVVCLKLGAGSHFSAHYFDLVRRVYPAALQESTAGAVGSLFIIEADSCSQLAEYIRLAIPAVSARILAIIREPPNSNEELSDCLSARIADFLIEPICLAELHFRLCRMLHWDAFEPQSEENLFVIGKSAPIKAVIAKAIQVARVDAPVVVLGETGSGKELVARAIHYHSQRKGFPFLPVNCGALPDHLFENELFGHAKGAFTDAKTTAKGLAAEAEGGTLFLDEIDALSIQSQVKLLRFVQLGEYRPLGSSRSLKADIRIIAASNADLAQFVESGRFRQDLFHRLNVVNISVPALRERSEDVPLLARHFLSKYTHESPFPFPRLSDAALTSLTAYSWPGNVRELEGEVRRALILARNDVLGPCDFDACRGATEVPADGGALRSFQKTKTLLIQQFEREYLAKLMQDHLGNVSRASRAAGTPRRCLQRLLQKHGLRSISALV